MIIKVGFVIAERQKTCKRLRCAAIVSLQYGIRVFKRESYSPPPLRGEESSTGVSDRVAIGLNSRMDQGPQLHLSSCLYSCLGHHNVPAYNRK